MKRSGLVLVLILAFPSLALASAANTSSEKELVTLLEKKYGNDYMQKLEKIATVQEKIRPLRGSKANRLKTLLEKTKQDIILQNLADYATRKYIQSGLYEKEDFLSAYEKLRQTDSRADIHPFYLRNLIRSLQENPFPDEDSMKFRALIFLLFSLSERVRNNPAFDENIRANWEEAWNDAKNISGAKIATSKAPIYARILEEVARYDHINPYSQDDLSYMREVIGREKISPNSAYFKAYLSLREKLVSLEGKLHLPTRFVHSVQSRKLSCEANTATDLINFYRTNSHLVTMNENDFINSLPIRSDKIVHTKTDFIWGDPNRYFVGNMDGKQSSNPNIFTGYGIYADGIAPIINRFLSPQNLFVQPGTFDERHILDSLSEKHPVMFWYLSAISESENGEKKYSTKPIVWKTPEGKDIRGYIGEHAGLIVGADFDRSGHITTVSYYQGRSESLETANFQELQKLSSFFNEALYVEKR
ncbi:MAG: hypothetical protein PHH16_04755 [Candidatus Gracilibacteria bacterium]|nr:hypothetical protein [Candidatus Gracilibacteria bacterium]